MNPDCTSLEIFMCIKLPRVFSLVGGTRNLMSLDQNGVKGTCRELADTGNEEKIMSVKKTTQVLQL